MSKAGVVFRKWMHHVKTDIHAKSSMKFGKGVNVKKTGSFYIVGDTSATRECFVFAHGGSFDEDYLLS
jgi:hypothetical protein